jgi:hypothetical protein
VLPGKYFGKSEGTHVFLGCDPVASQLRARKVPAQRDDQFVTSWCDLLVKPFRYTLATGINPSRGADDPSQVDMKQSKTHDMPAKWKSASIGLYRLDPNAWVRTIGVTTFRWKAIAYWKFPKWRPIAAPTDPGYAVSDWTDVVIDETNVGMFVKFKNWQKVKIKLGARPGHLEDPGHYLVVDGHQLKFTVYIEFAGTQLDGLGGGWHGFIDMSTQMGNFNDAGLIGVLVHELGHNLGQAYGDKTADGTFGLAAGNQTPGIPFAAVVPGGYIYGGHAHTGVHCAYGIKDADRTEGHTQNSYQAKKFFSQAKCAMFGAGDMASSSPNNKFCKECEPHVKAADASYLKRAWET